MFQKFLSCTAIALLTTSPAIAAPQPKPHHTAMAKQTTAAPIKTTSATANKTATASKHRHLAKKVSMRGHSEVHALNALESHGYRQFVNLHAQGSDFVATARKNGKLYNVTVLPSGQIRATIA